MQISPQWLELSELRGNFDTSYEYPPLVAIVSNGVGNYWQFVIVKCGLKNLSQHSAKLFVSAVLILK
jgi:hypothetical protein